MYADKITDSMQLTIDETNRRRSIQLAYNEEHGITPTAIIKARNAIIGIDDSSSATSAGKSGKRNRQGESIHSIPYGNEYTTTVDIAADPVIPYMNKDELQRSINRMRLQMLDAAKKMEFIEAARLRDEILKMEGRLAEL